MSSGPSSALGRPGEPAFSGGQAVSTLRVARASAPRAGFEVLENVSATATFAGIVQALLTRRAEGSLRADSLCLKPCSPSLAASELRDGFWRNTAFVDSRYMLSTALVGSVAKDSSYFVLVER